MIALKQIQTQESRRPSWSTRWFHNRLQQGMISYFLTLYNQTSVCIFSILFSIHFLRHRQGEFLQQLRGSLVVIISFILMTLMWEMQHWYCKEKLDASHSSCVINWLMGKLNPMWVSIDFYFPLKTHCIKNTYGSLSPTPSCLIWQGTETFIGLFHIPSPSPPLTNTSPSLVIH